MHAALAIPTVDLVIVVDDASQDDTFERAAYAGAFVVRHKKNHGKGYAMQTGYRALVAQKGIADATAPYRLLLFIDADLEHSAAQTHVLIDPVARGEADLTIAILPTQQGAAGHGFVVGTAQKTIESLTGWMPTQPLSGMRCMTVAAFTAALPLEKGWGVETGMIIDVLARGFTIMEVPAQLQHRASGTSFTDQLHRFGQLVDVVKVAVPHLLRKKCTHNKQRNIGSSTGNGDAH